jgi:hypothetical protein
MSWASPSTVNAVCVVLARTAGLSDRSLLTCRLAFILEGIVITEPDYGSEQAASTLSHQAAPRSAEEVVGMPGPAAFDKIASMDGASRVRTIQRLQRSSGNAVVARMLHGRQRVLARDGGVVAGLVLGAVAIVQSQVNASNGGLTYSSDQITYPKDASRIEGLVHKEYDIARFLSTGTFVDNDTTFRLYGDFTAHDEETPTMANVYIDLAKTTTYYTSALTFKAVALQTAYGSASDPRIRFVCSGRFDPAGQGDTTYRVVIEIDKMGRSSVVSKEIVNGDGQIINKHPGFQVISGPGNPVERSEGEAQDLTSAATPPSDVE